METATLSNISKYIKKNAYDTVMARGKNIFNIHGRVKIQLFDSEKNLATYDVRGDSGLTYRVFISNFNNETISSSCSCAFDWGAICKHEVAALLSLENDLLKGNISNHQQVAKILPIRTINYRYSTEPYCIANYASLTPESALKHCAKTFHDRFVIRDFRVFHEKRTMKFVLEEPNDWDTRQEFTIALSVQSPEQLEFSCTCNNKVEFLCEHASEIFKIIAIEKKISDFLAVLQPDYINNKKSEIIREFGLPENTPFDDYFKIEYSLNGISITNIKKGLGLQRIRQYRQAVEKKTIALLSEISNPTLLNLPTGIIAEEPNELQNRKMGYVLVPGKISDMEVYPQLIPVCGKPSKDGNTLSHLRQINKKEYQTHVSLSEDDRTLLMLAKTLNDTLAKEQLNITGLQAATEEISSSEKQKFYLAQLKQIVPLLEKQPFLFYYLPFRNVDEWNAIGKHELLPMKISSVSPFLTFRLYEKDNIIILQAQYQLGENNIDIDHLDPDLIYPFLFTLIDNTYHLNHSVGESQALQAVRQNPVIKTVRADFDNFYEDVVKPVAKKFPLSFKKISGIKKISETLLPQEKQVYISETGNFVLFRPFVKYSVNRSKDEIEKIEKNEFSVEILNNSNLIEKNGDTIASYERDLLYENDFIAALQNLHPRFANQCRNDFFYISVDEMLKENWFFTAFQKLRDANVNVFGYNQLKSFQYSPYQATVKVELSSGADWFDVQLQVGFGDFNVSLSDIQKAVFRNERYVKLSDGTMGLLPQEWFEKFKKYFQHGEINEEKIQISKLRFSIIDDLFDNISDVKILKELEEKRQRLLAFKEIKKVKIPHGVTAQLRDYQKEGLNWMHFLYKFRWGGILADDMGLGKTLQALTFLTHISQHAKKASLVVVPTSLMFNWENEIKKFAPVLKVFFYHGSEREKKHSLFKNYNIVFTTYGLMARDIEVFQKYKFNYAVLDESQAIKNPLSQRYKAACLLRAENRLALSGTPVENNTFDLFAQMNFLNPGFLGSAESFKKNYTIPIDRDRDAQRAKELHKLINPFIIRRTKEQVEKDLPAKTEDIIYCNMEAEQQKVYDAFRNKYRNYLMGKIEEEGLAKSKIYVLEGLTKLRQICDSPAILSDDEKYTSESVKIKELLRHIHEKTANHKLLVFSQFVKMLQLIRKQLDDGKISYQYLDGKSTPEQRQNSVEHFQTNEQCRVFLISLKAGGLGLNLTAADYVYIVDPWWNPAVENQAIDRCHRIGQNKKVIAYRMLCKNTVEEKILNLQTKKKQIAADIIQTDESLMKSITQSDIEKLFG